MAAVVVMAFLAVTSGSVRVAGAEAPTVAVSVSPTTGLQDGQEITITGTGTMPPSVVTAVLCPTGETDCWPGLGTEEATVDGFLLTGRVRALVATESDAPVDCRAAPCEVVVRAWDHEAEVDWELARVPVAFDPDAALLDPPTVAVDPDEDLVDAQTVVVSGDGHLPLRGVWIEQCPVADDAGQQCHSMGLATADGDGRFARSVEVRATLPVDMWGTGQRVDCRNPATPCQVVTASSWGVAATPIAFDPESPVSPGPTIVVSPATNIVGGATVTVTGRGFTPDDMVDLQLCAVSTSRCDITDLYVESQEDGTFVTEMVLHAEIADRIGFLDCGVAPGCEVRARDWGAFEVARAPVSFRPAAEPAVRYLDPVFPEVEVIRGVVYRQTTDVDGNDVELALDIYLPVGDTAAERPVAMWMFGGWFMFGDRAQLAAYAMDSARRGYVGVAIDYRIRPGMDLTDVIDAAADAEVDARAAIDWLRAHAGEYRLDPDAIVAGGVSAGAVLAWNLAYGSDDLDPGPSPIAAAVPISGLPFSGPEAGAPPVIAFHAVDDGVLPIGGDREKCALAAGVGALCQLVEMPDGGHYIAESHVRQIVGTAYPFLAEHVLRPLGYFEAVPRPPVRPWPYPGGPGTTPTTSTSVPASSIPQPTSTTATTVVPTTGPVPPPTTAPRLPTPSPGPSTPPRTGGSGGVVPDATAAEPVRARPRVTG